MRRKSNAKQIYAQAESKTNPRIGKAESAFCGHDADSDIIPDIHFSIFRHGNTYAELINSGVRDITKLSEALVYDLMGNTGALVLRLVFSLLNTYISFGLVCYSFRLSSGETAVPLQEMFPPVLSFLKFFLLTIITSIVAAIGMLFFIVPGIILALCYSQAKYIMLDHPEMSVIQCMTASRKLMRGHLGEYFVLVLSFIGWNILTSISVITGIWTYPYTGITMALYYRAVSTEITV